MSTDARIDLEMTYSRQICMDDTCRDVYAPLVECMRARRHALPHAHGFGKDRTYWS